MDLELSGCRVLITGGSRGIGRAAACAFASEGCEVHVTARGARELSELQECVANDYGVKIGTTVTDMSDDDAARRIVSDAGRVDVLINNAGAIPSGNLWQVGASEWAYGWRVKCLGYVNLTREVYSRMKSYGAGVIINNIGNGGEVGDPEYIAGACGNSSLMTFTRALGGRSLDDGIRVVGINPGPVNTDRIYKMLKIRAKAELGAEDRWGELVQLYPLHRPAHVSEIVDVMLFLASPRAAYISGTIVTVDGGISSRRSVV